METQEKNQTTLQYVFILALIILAFAACPYFEPISFKEDLFTLALSRLGVLFVLALFVEKSLDVYLTISRAHISDGYDYEIHNRQEKLKEPNMEQAAIKEINDEIKKIEKKKAKAKNKTRQTALIMGLFCGVIISILGVRTLEAFVIQNAFDSLTRYQRFFFKCIDILLTSGLIGGGSEAIHKMTEVYRSYGDALTSINRKNIQATTERNT